MSTPRHIQSPLIRETRYEAARREDERQRRIFILIAMPGARLNVCRPISANTSARDTIRCERLKCASIARLQAEETPDATIAPTCRISNAVENRPRNA